MTTENTSQSQPSYLHTIEEKPNYQAILHNQLVDQLSATLAMNRLAAFMIGSQGIEFQNSLKSLQILFSKGYSYLLTTHTLLLRKLMNHFTKLGKQIQDDGSNSKTQIRMLYVLSVIAEMLRNNPKYYYPFTRKFLMTVFLIDSQLLNKLEMKNQVLAILGVIYQNLSRQPKLVIKNGIESNLKKAVLDVYSLIQEISTLKIMNKVIQNLVSKGIFFSVAQFHKYRVLETVSKIISKNQTQLFLIKMKMTMLNLKTQKENRQQSANLNANLRCKAELKGEREGGMMEQN